MSVNCNARQQGHPLLCSLYYENSMELGHLNSTQKGQLNPLFHTHGFNELGWSMTDTHN